MGIVQKYFNRDKLGPQPLMTRPTKLAQEIQSMFWNGLPRTWGNIK